MHGYIHRNYTHTYFELPGRAEPAEPASQNPLDAALKAIWVLPRRELDPDPYQASDCLLKYQPAFKSWLRQYQAGAVVPTVTVYLQHTPEPCNPYPGSAVGIVYDDPMLGAVCTGCHHCIDRTGQCRCPASSSERIAVLAPARNYRTSSSQPAGDPGALAADYNVVGDTHIPTAADIALQEAHARAFSPPARQKAAGTILVSELEAVAQPD